MTKALTLISAVAIALLAATAGCAEHLADCVEVYPNTGATRRPGYTKAGCEQHCASLQGLLDCYWDGRLGLVTEPAVVVSTRNQGAD